jgi:hypothetical protein
LGINAGGVNIALAETGNQEFDLDFGEQMFVVLNTGCHKISGQAKLREQYFSIIVGGKTVALGFSINSPT